MTDSEYKEARSRIEEESRRLINAANDRYKAAIEGPREILDRSLATYRAELATKMKALNDKREAERSAEAKSRFGRLV